MKRTFGLLIFCLTCVASYAASTEPHRVFSYEFGGGLPGSTHYMYTVSEDGIFAVATEGLPITDHGLTKHNFTTKVSKDEVLEIVALAVNARDFVNNPSAPWPDCGWAEMIVINGREKIMRRSGCIDLGWAEQAQTKLLLAKIEGHLPKDMRQLP